jgi:hypothetical protein
MFHLLLYHCGIIHFLTHVQGVIKIVWHSNMRFKQRAVTEFLVAEEEVVTKFISSSKMYMVPMLLITASLVMVLKKAKQ